MISLVNHMNILVIEDEQLLSGSLRELLAQHGFAAEAAYDGPLGLELALTGVYDLIILDVMLPGMDGYEIARRLRSKRVGTPILMLTARSGLDDRVEGLDAGADYYLAKPFETRELLACINAILRRQGAQVEELRYGDAASWRAASFRPAGASSARKRCSSRSGAGRARRWRTTSRSTSASCAKSSPRSDRRLK